ncbi:MAG: hypothetical protein WAK92_02965, partial [Thiobacillus sp.]
MPTQSKVDFIIIGAQKAGTTSLFHYLRAHRQIHIPFVKEVGFFSRERLFNKGVSWYLNQFADATPHQIVGEASPQINDESGSSRPHSCPVSRRQADSHSPQS